MTESATGSESHSTVAKHAPPYARVVLRPIATPLSLGFLGLGVASFVEAGLELRWIDPTTNWKTVGLLVMAFAVPLQSVSAVFGFLARDAVTATGMGIVAGSWLGLGAATYTGTPGSPSGAVGLLLLASATALVVPAAAGVSSKILASVVLGTAAIRFYLTGAYELSGSPTWRVAAGVCGLVLSGIALYAALAFELESTQRRTMLPTGRRGRGREALAGDFPEEVEGLQHEAGVRQQL